MIAARLIFTRVFFLEKCVLTTAKTMAVDRKYLKALALQCLTSELLRNAANSSDVLRLDSMLRQLRKLLCYDKQGCFSWENVFGPPQKPWLGTEKPEGISSARFGIRTAVKCCELNLDSSVVPTEFAAEPTTKIKSSQSNS